jgi:hypothetical protein
MAGMSKTGPGFTQAFRQRGQFPFEIGGIEHGDWAIKAKTEIV